MNLSQLERAVQMHRAYANSFLQHFKRLSGRLPTAAEVQTLENAPLVFTGMRLELLELRFSRATTYSEVAAEIEFMQKEVLASTPDLQRNFEASASTYNFHPETTATYLGLEEQLLSHVQKHGLLS